MITTALVFGVTFFLALMVSWNLAAPIFFAPEQDELALRDFGPSTNQKHSSLVLDRERLFLSLEEVESDYRGGKITAQEYGNEKEKLVTQLAAVIRALEGNA